MLALRGRACSLDGFIGLGMEYRRLGGLWWVFGFLVNRGSSMVEFML